MIAVKVRQNETLEQALRRFRRKVRKSGLLQQIRRRGQYEKPSERRRRKLRLARKRISQQADEEERQQSTPRYVRG